MPSGAAVIRRDGVRGVTWYVKFRDADGRQVKRRLEPLDGPWNEKRAQRALGVELERVEREQWTKPTKLTFAKFAEEWQTAYLPSRNLKASTLSDYRNTLRHAIGFFGETPLEAIGPEQLDGYVSAKTAEGLGPKTIANHLATLHEVWKVAKRWRRVRSNPLEEVERPRLNGPVTVILSEDEVSALFAAFKLLAFEGTPEESVWWDLTRRMVVVALGTAMRRGELLALKWEDVEMLERRLQVRHSIWRGKETTPKSKAARRTLHFGLKTAAVLQEQWQASRFNADTDHVFAHPQLGRSIDPAKLTRSYLRPAMVKAGITKAGAWHVLRHTSLTAEAACGNPNSYVQARAGHASFSVTERYIHSAQVAFPGAVERAEERLFPEG
jgi:integrase